MRTTQVEAPLCLVTCLQDYIEYGADPRKVWQQYGVIVRGVLESYLPGERAEVAMHPNGLLWAQKDGVALSWMNAYIDGRAVTGIGRKAFKTLYLKLKMRYLRFMQKMKME